jgi:hypothetical protein
MAKTDTAPDHLKRLGMKTLRLAFWFGVRMLFVAALFGGIGLLVNMSWEPIEGEAQELFFYLVFAVVAALVIWLFWSLLRLIFDSISSFRSGLREGRSND